MESAALFSTFLYAVLYCFQADNSAPPVKNCSREHFYVPPVEGRSSGNREKCCSFSFRAEFSRPFYACYASVRVEEMLPRKQTCINHQIHYKTQGFVPKKKQALWFINTDRSYGTKALSSWNNLCRWVVAANREQFRIKVGSLVHSYWWVVTRELFFTQGFFRSQKSAPATARAQGQLLSQVQRTDNSALPTAWQRVLASLALAICVAESVTGLGLACSDCDFASRQNEHFSYYSALDWPRLHLARGMSCMGHNSATAVTHQTWKGNVGNTLGRSDHITVN